MPVISVKIPHDAFPGAHRAILIAAIVDAAAAAEQIPDDPVRRMFCIVTVEEVAAGNWASGSPATTAQVLPCVVNANVPAGVLDARSRAVFADLVGKAFVTALPASDKRKLVTSLVLQEVADGAWGVNGTIRRLEQFAAAAGYAHLQTAEMA